MAFEAVLQGRPSGFSFKFEIAPHLRHRLSRVTAFGAMPNLSAEEAGNLVEHDY